MNASLLTPFAISSLLIFLSSFVVIAILLIYGKQRIHRLLILFNLCLCLWGLGSLLTQFDRTIFFWNIAYCGVIFSTISYCHLVFEFTHEKNRHVLYAMYIYGIIASLLALTNNIGIIMKFRFDSIYFATIADSRPIIIGLIWFMLGVFGFYKLYFGYLTAKDALKKNQIAYLFIASLIAFGAGIFIFLTSFGVEIYPHANILVAFYGAIITYAIIKHQLMDIRIFLQKSFIYSSLIAALTISYLVTVFLMEKVFQGVLGYRSLTVSLVSSITIAIFFIPARNILQRFTDQFFFKGSPAEIAQENEYLRKEVAQAEKMKAVATLASGMAHEIRNPLTVIQTFFDQLPAKKDNPEFMRQLNTLVGKEVNRINDLVSQLLEFSKPSPLSLQETNIRKLIEDCLNLLGGQLTKHNIQIVKNFNADRHILMADANKLKQVFLNLFMNAIDAMPSGGTLTVSVKQSAVSTQPSAKSLQAEGCLLIAVQDTGCGISAEDLKHIFEPFFTKKEKGTGLGLAVCKNIIEEHGGTISATSTVGQGTTFNLKFSLEHNTYAA